MKTLDRLLIFIKKDVPTKSAELALSKGEFLLINTLKLEHNLVIK